MRQDFNSLGDNLKIIESKNEEYLNNSFPVYARLDGKNFSKFTKHMNKPFDDIFNQMMVDVATALLEETNATLAYHQSDEISLYWEDIGSWFNGRKSKILGELVGLSAAVINQLTSMHYPMKLGHFPRFDCRIFNVDEKTAVDFFLWRQMDCIKNSVSMQAQQHFSHNQLHKINTKTKKEWLAEIGQSWDEIKPAYRYGTFVRKVQTVVPVSDSGIDPAYHHDLPTEIVRNRTKHVVYSPLQNFENHVNILNWELSKPYVIETP